MGMANPSGMLKRILDIAIDADANVSADIESDVDLDEVIDVDASTC